MEKNKSKHLNKYQQSDGNIMQGRNVKNKNKFELTYLATQNHYFMN